MKQNHGMVSVNSSLKLTKIEHYKHSMIAILGKSITAHGNAKQQTIQHCPQRK